MLKAEYQEERMARGLVHLICLSYSKISKKGILLLDYFKLLKEYKRFQLFEVPLTKYSVKPESLHISFIYQCWLRTEEPEEVPRWIRLAGPASCIT